MAAEKILLIEDDPSVVRFLELELIHEGYQLEKEYDGRIGLSRAIEEPFDLILLDVMLPSLNGMEVLRRFRQESSTPVIMLTAKDDVTNKVMGLDIGADDYITKPFLIEELLARVRAVLRRKMSNYQEAQLLSFENLSINPKSRFVSYHDEEIILTKREYDLLVYLMENINTVLTREQIIEHVWGLDYYGDTNVVDVYIKCLRKKIEERFETRFIYTIRGVGYTIKNG